MTRGMRLLALGVVVGGLLAGCGLLDEEVPTAEVGECVTNDVETGGLVSELDTVSCTETHKAELYDKFDLEGDSFPGAEEVNSQAQEGCQSAFEDYVGTPAGESEIFFTAVTPTEETWNEADDREVLCFAFLPGGDLTESVEGSER